MQAQEALRAYQFDWDDEMVRLARARVCVWVRVNRIDAIVHFQRGLSQSNETNQIELTQVDYNLIRELLAYIVNSGYEQVHAKHTHTHTQHEAALLRKAKAVRPYPHLLFMWCTHTAPPATFTRHLKNQTHHPPHTSHTHPPKKNARAPSSSSSPAGTTSRGCGELKKFSLCLIDKTYDNRPSQKSVQASNPPFYLFKTI